jgi:exosortase
LHINKDSCFQAANEAIPPALYFFVLVGLFLALFWSRLIGLVQLWGSDGVYSFSVLVPVISGGLVYWRRKRLKQLEIRPRSVGIAVTAAAVTLKVLLDASHLAISSATPLLIVGTVGGAVLAIWGWARLRFLAFPLLFLLAMVPVPAALFEVIDYPLQVLCAKVTAGLAHAVGMAVERSGVFLMPESHPSLLVNIAPACNGVRSAVSLLLIAVLFTYLVEGQWYRRVLVVLVAVPLAYFANFIRLFVNVCLVETANPMLLAHEQTSDYLFGAIAFVLALMLLFWLARRVGCARFREIG